MTHSLVIQVKYVLSSKGSDRLYMVLAQQEHTNNTQSLSREDGVVHGKVAFTLPNISKTIRVVSGVQIKAVLFCQGKQQFTKHYRVAAETEPSKRTRKSKDTVDPKFNAKIKL